MLLICSLLQSMGFNLKENLQRFHDVINNKQVDELEAEKIKAATLKCKGLSYAHGDDGPIQLSESL